LRAGPVLRKLALAVHLSVSVGWVGAAAAYLTLDLVAATAEAPPSLRAAYVAMGWVAGNVIVPLAIASLATGVLVSVTTPWGLFRHYWVVISLVMTIVAVAVLLVEMRVIGRLSEIAEDPATPTEQLRAQPSTLVHSIGGLVVLLVVLFLNVYKPRGLTRYGWRKQREGSRAKGSGSSR
jgi:uncharacterized membrane protein